MAPRTPLVIATLVLTSFVATGAPATAQEQGRAEIVLADGSTVIGPVPRSALRSHEHEVTEARCRSCTGRHTSYALGVHFDTGAIESVRISVDFVGSPREVTIGNGPYPANSSVWIRMRGASEDVEIEGSLDVESEAGGTRVVVRAEGAHSPVRTMTFHVPRS